VPKKKLSPTKRIDLKVNRSNSNSKKLPDTTMKLLGCQTHRDNTDLVLRRRKFPSHAAAMNLRRVICCLPPKRVFCPLFFPPLFTTVPLAEVNLLI